MISLCSCLRLSSMIFIFDVVVITLFAMRHDVIDVDDIVVIVIGASWLCGFLLPAAEVTLLLVPCHLVLTCCCIEVRRVVK